MSWCLFPALSGDGLEIRRHPLGLLVVFEAVGAGLQQLGFAPPIVLAVLGQDVGDLRRVGQPNCRGRRKAG